MLLYDRVFEHATHYARRAVARGEDLNVFERSGLDSLPRACVYEISDVAPLFRDWETESVKRVPRRPPHSPCWAEWRESDARANGTVDLTRGVIVENLPRDMIAYLAAKELPIGKCFARLLARGDEVWACRQFAYIHEADVPGWPRHPGLASAIGMYFFTLGESATTIDLEYLCPPECLTGQDGDVMYGLAAYDVGLPGDYDRSPWQPFMAFALLHCKNVVTEDNAPDELTQRRVRKAGNPPRVTYKTLRIEVPRTAHARQCYEGLHEDASPRVRFHLCSGHFRELRSERFTAKKGQWVWVPAHWRGSKDLGEVHKTYRLEASP